MLDSVMDCLIMQLIFLVFLLNNKRHSFHLDPAQKIVKQCRIHFRKAPIRSITHICLAPYNVIFSFHGKPMKPGYERYMSHRKYRRYTRYWVNASCVDTGHLSLWEWGQNDRYRGRTDLMPWSSIFFISPISPVPSMSLIASVSPIFLISPISSISPIPPISPLSPVPPIVLARKFWAFGSVELYCQYKTRF
jgi:hypothetical protein